MPGAPLSLAMALDDIFRYDEYVIDPARDTDPLPLRRWRTRLHGAIHLLTRG